MKYYLKSLLGYWPTAKALSSNVFGAAFLFAYLLSIPVKNRLLGRKARMVKLSFGSLKNIPFFVRDGSDISALREVFAEDEYKLNGSSSFSHIADIGAHIGSASLYFLAVYPNVTITAYEPDPENFEILSQNLKNFNRVKLVNAAVAAEDGYLTFFKSRGSSTKSSIIKVEELDREIKVPSVSLETVLKKGFDLVKFDIEGAEFSLFSAVPDDILKKINIYIGEVHFSLTGKTKEEFESLFPEFNISWKSQSSNYSIVCISK